MFHKVYSSVEYLSTVISPCKKRNVELEVRQNISNNPEPENFSEAESRLVEDALPDPTQKSIFARNTEEIIPAPTIDVQNDVHVLQPESVKQCDCFDFNHPSKFWLKNACKKLNMNYDQNAYKFWSNINIDEIKDVSKPDYIRSVKGGKSSCFRALSYLLSGVENKEIKTTIRTYFYDNFKDLGVIAEYDFATLTINDKIVKDTILAEQMTPILWETIAKYLECRIGIFEDDKLAKYGNWIKNDEEIVTLLFEKDNENYRIVMELSDI
uniref:Uncharacterized protein n=1 Tax=Panagrolaimus sp. PS1159 TaxID=55785 RepID=A0AC35EWX0_9BILA